MRIIYLFVCLLVAVSGNAQLLSWGPSFIQESSTSVTITCDATKGNQGLKDYTPASDVYVHIGVITTASTSSADWKYVPFTWGSTTAAAQAVYLGINQWTYTITGGLRTFFNITNTSEKILRIAILFRNGAGTKKLANTDGSDMYVPVYDNGLYARIDTPLRQPTFIPIPEPVIKNVGDTIPVLAKASQSSTLKIYFNGTVVDSAPATTQLSAKPVVTANGTQTIIAEANNGTVTARDTISFLVSGSTTVAPLPNGVADGVNYESGDSSVTLVLYAPKKNKILVLGDFNNWTPLASYQMNETPDSTRFWLRITGLAPGVEYAYQYFIDGSITVADYNAEKILDKNVDPNIPSAIYPNLKPFPAKATGNLAGILQTAKPQYNWQATNYTRPDKRNLIVYELLIRDFTAAKSWKALQDTLSYLKRLGVNAIEVMPFNNFEGYSSWGYNPNFYFAPDKVYGTETAVCRFVDACHQQGMAVIMDMVMNHSFGSSPMVQMYWDATKNIPAANSPWFNQYPTHAYNVGYQFNHQSPATIDFRNRVIKYWLTKYKIDGFRWDLAKGFTQTQTCDATGNNCNVGAWGNYDASRVATWKNIYDQMQTVSPNSYCILEMFADNAEEKAEADYGMLIWGNMNANFNQATMGYSNPSWDLSYGIYTNRGYAQPNLVTYQESHDEERLMFKNEQYGNSNASYTIKDTATGLKRNAMATAFWAMIPGPKMLWQFGELGYDYSINTCPNGTVDATGNCRTDPKPLRWDYYQNINRQALYNIYAQLFKLRNTPNYFTTFTAPAAITYHLGNAFKQLTVTSDSLNIVVIGNFDVTPQSGTVTFPSPGTWYSYLTAGTRTATGAAESISLQPGEYYVYTNKNINNSVATAVNNVSVSPADMEVVIAPNPANQSATITYHLPESGMVNISLLDMKGKRLAILFTGFKTKGQQTLLLNRNGFNTSRLNNGMYVLMVEQNGKRKAGKFIINNR